MGGQIKNVTFLLLASLSPLAPLLLSYCIVKLTSSYSLGHAQLRRTSLPAHISPTVSLTQAPIMVGGSEKPVLKLKDMEEKHLHNLFLKNMSGLIEEVKNPTPRLNP